METKDTGHTAAGTKKKRGSVGRAFFTLCVIALAAYFGRAVLNPGRVASATDGPPMGGMEAGSAGQEMPQQAPLVRVQEAEMGDVSVARDYIGVVEAIQTVSLRPEVSAKIEKVHFKEGAQVKAGDVLFTLDDKPFQATVALRRAEVAKAQANYDRAKKYYDRLKAADKRSVSATDLDTAQNDVQQGKAAVDEAKASLQLAQIDLDNTKIAAPISGRIGRTDYTKGNYVAPSGEVLATIVQTDPVRVSFSLPDREYLDELDAFGDSGKNVYRATLRLANNEEYPYAGERDFEDNAMDADSGTITVSLRFKNDRSALVPGAMTRVSLMPREEQTGVLVPQVSVQSDREGDYVFVVGEGGVARRREVVLGAEIKDKREIASGLEPGETVVTQGAQSLRAETKVRIAENNMQATLLQPQGK